MASDTKTLKGYVKTENMILLVVTALALGFVGGVVFSVYRTTAAMPAASENASQIPITDEQQQRLATLNKLTQNNPSDVGAWTQLGHLYFDTGQPAKAIQAYERSLSLDGNRPDVWTDLGVMYRRNGDPKKAMASFDKALSIKPDHQIALYNKGIVLLHDLRDPKGAAEVWEKLLHINPNFQTPNNEPLRNIVEQLKQNVKS